jgi:acetyl esterase/lipase
VLRPVCRHLLHRFALLALALLAAGCSPLAALNAAVPDEGFVVSRDHGYGPLPRQTLDVYAPRGVSQPAPVVVFFYGGAWQHGRRADYKFVGEALTSKGFVVVIPDYRLYPDVRFPSFLEDGGAAVAWTQREIRRFGGDPHRIFLMGHSAGAYNAAMIALDTRYVEAAGGRSADVIGFIGLAGPYDIRPDSSILLDNVFGGASDLSAVQPANFVEANSPRALLLYGEQDTTVLPRHSKEFSKRIRAAGGRVWEVGYADLGHASIVGVLAKPYQGRAPVLEEVTRFITTGETKFASQPALVE